MIPETNNNIEDCGAGIYREWLHNHCILKINLPDFSRKTVELYSELVLQTIKDWTRDKPYYALYDISHPKMGFSPQMRQYNSQFTSAVIAQKMRGSMAMILPQGIVGQLLKPVMKQQTRVLEPNIETRCFFSQAAGLAWLEEYLAHSSTM